MQLAYVFINLYLTYQAFSLSDTNFSLAWKKFTQDSQLSHATYSLTILDNSTGNITFEFNKDVGLAPASILKTVTGSAALHYLGPDYRYRTLLQYSGTIDPQGKLNGYVYIVGSGDPSFGSWRWNETSGETIMRQWIDILNAKGIKECQGIVVDLSIWLGQTQTTPAGYPWGDLGNRYGAGGSALNWRENQFSTYLTPGNAVGDPVTILSFDRPPPGVTFFNEIITGPPASGDQTILYLAPDGTTGYFRGTLSIDSPKKLPIGGAIPNASLYIANELIQSMKWPNTTPIKVIYRKESNVSARTTLATHQSPPLSEIIYQFERASVNLYGELLVKTMAYALNSTIGSVLQKYCQNVHGIEPSAVALMDGSGLSPENRITTGAIARVLFNVRKRAPWFPTFEKALPVINNIRMKSGYILNVLSYAGYVNKQVFSLIVNNFNGQTAVMRQKMWNLLNTLK